MPIICKIQLDTADFKAQLDAIARHAERVQADIASNAGRAAQSVDKAADSAARGVSSTADKAARGVSSTADKAARGVSSAADKAARTVETLAENSARASGSVAENATAAGVSVGANAEKSAKTVQEVSAAAGRAVSDAAGKSAESVADAANASAESMENVKAASDDAASGMQAIGEEAESAAEATETGMRKSVSATRDLISALGGLSQTIGSIGKMVVAILTDNPIALVAAAIATLISEITYLWDAATMSASEYLKVLNSILEMQAKETSLKEEQFSAAERYLSRLEEIDAMENKGNAAKAEQARLLEILAKRYGDLGIIIDEDTGKLASFDRLTGKADFGMDKARANLNRLKKREIGDSLTRELDASEGKLQKLEIDPVIFDKLLGTQSITLSEILGRVEKAQSHNRMAEDFGLPRIDIDAVRKSQREDLAKFLGKEYLPDEDTIDQLNAYLAALDQNLDIRQKIKSIVQTGYTTEAEEVSSLSEATSREQVRTAYQNPNPSPAQNPEETKLGTIRNAVQGVIDRYQMLKREQELIADGKEREAMIEKETVALRRRAAQMGVELTQEQIRSMEEAVGSWYDYMQSISQEGDSKADPAALRENLADQAFSLLDAAKRKAGMDKEADEEKAIREAERIKGGKLDDDERAYVQKLVDLSRAVSGQEENPLAWKPDLSSRTNELTARGGFSSGAVMPSTEQINKSILSELQTKLKALGDIKELLQEGLQT